MAQNPITPASHRPRAEDWGSAQFVLPELDMLLELGRAAKHPQYSCPYVNVERLAAVGMHDDLPRKFSEGIEGGFARLGLSQHEQKVAALFYDEYQERQPLNVRAVIADALRSIERPCAQRPGIPGQENNPCDVLGYAQVLQTLAIKLQDSPLPTVSNIGRCIKYAI